MAAHNDRGKYGEKLAERYLVGLGHDILERNWRYKRSEIDLISKFEGKLIFTEVKTRGSSNFAEPEDFVDDVKVQQMEYAAEEYIEQYDHSGEVSFDIISVLLDKHNNHTINHIDDAFWPE